MKPSSMACGVLFAFLTACPAPDASDSNDANGGAGPVDEQHTQLSGAGAGDYGDPPPNAPPPPAVCGDMNGGGDQHVDFPTLMAMKQAEKAEVMQRQAGLLEQRYDLTDQPSPTLHMTRGKPVQTGVRARLPAGQTWDTLAAMTPAEIRTADLFPAGFLPLPHPKQPEGGMLFPHSHRRAAEPDRSRSHALRSRLRFAGSVFARVPCADLPHDAA